MTNPDFIEKSRQNLALMDEILQETKQTVAQLQTFQQALASNNPTELVPYIQNCIAKNYPYLSKECYEFEFKDGAFHLKDTELPLAYELTHYINGIYAGWRLQKRLMLEQIQAFAVEKSSTPLQFGIHIEEKR